MASVLRRTLTGGSLAAVVVLLVLADTQLPGHRVLWGVAAVLLLGASVEAGRLSVHLGQASTAALASASVAAWLYAVALARGSAWDPGGPLSQLALLYGLAALAAGLIGRARSVPILLALWIVPPLVALVLLTLRYGHGALAALVILSKVGDIAGYFGGRTFGRRHPFPRLSPGKTVEGCLASLAAGAAAGGLLGVGGWLVSPQLGLAGGLAAGAILNLAAQGGDLLESAVKRRAGVKDSSPWLGASGGLLDVLDSLLVTVPVAWAASEVLFQAAH